MSSCSVERFADQGLVARWNWIVALRQAVGLWPFCLAGDGGRCGGAERSADELSAGGDRLAQPAAHVAATERRLGSKNVLRCGRKDASNRPFCDSIRPWVTALNRCQTTSKRSNRHSSLLAPMLLPPARANP